MFDEIDGRNVVGSFLFQTIFAYLASFALLLIVGSTLFAGPEAPMKEIQFGAVVALSGLLAAVVRRVVPSSTVAGRWIWIFPVALELMSAVSWANEGWLGKLFYVGPGDAEGGWGIVFVTYPTWGCCWYSAAMWWARRSIDRTSKRDL